MQAGFYRKNFPLRLAIKHLKNGFSLEREAIASLAPSLQGKGPKGVIL